MSIINFCDYCGNCFDSIRNSKKYCSNTCKIYAYRARLVAKKIETENQRKLNEMRQEQNEYFERVRANFERYTENFMANKNK